MVSSYESGKWTEVDRIIQADDGIVELEFVVTEESDQRIFLDVFDGRVSTRLKNLIIHLFGAGISIAKLKNFTNKELRRLPKFGSTSVGEIRSLIGEGNISFSIKIGKNGLHMIQK